MDFEKVASAWASQSPEGVMIQDESALLAELQRRHRRWSRRLVGLNVREVVPTLCLMLLFGSRGLRDPYGRWPFLVAAVLCLLICTFLVVTTIRQRVRERAFGSSVREELRRSLSQVNHLIWLAENVWWWYLLPIVAGCALIVYWLGSMKEGGEHKLWYTALVLPFFYGVHWLNVRVARKRHHPHKQMLVDMLDSIGTG